MNGGMGSARVAWQAEVSQSGLASRGLLEKKEVAHRELERILRFLNEEDRHLHKVAEAEERRGPRHSLAHSHSFPSRQFGGRELTTMIAFPVGGGGGGADLQTFALIIREHVPLPSPHAPVALGEWRLVQWAAAAAAE